MRNCRCGLLWLVSALVALFALIASDLFKLSPKHAFFVLGGTATAYVPFLSVEMASLRVPRVESLSVHHWRRLALITLVGGPVGLALVLLAPRVSDGQMLRTLPVFVCLGGVALLVYRWLLARVALPRTARFWFLAWIAALELVALFVALHLLQGTLWVVRPGREFLHEALFGASMLVTWGLWLPWSVRIWSRDGASLGTVSRLVWTLLALLAGATLLALDRRVAVGFYPPLHYWFLALGTLSVEAAVVPWLSRVPAHGRIGQAALALGAASAILITSSIAFFVGSAELVGDPFSRSRVVKAAAGPGLLRWHTLLQGRRSKRALATDHPMLEYDQLLDEPVSGPKANILLITIDALRADAALGQNLETDVDLPTFSRLARQCAVFERAYAPGSRTAIGLGAFMAGRYSANMDWELWFYRKGRIVDPASLDRRERRRLRRRSIRTTIPKMPPGGPLASRLRDAGMWTIGVAYGGPNDFFLKGNRYDTGFDDYVEVEPRSLKAPSSKRLAELAIERLESAPRGMRWFQWVHLYDPHKGKGDRPRYESRVAATDAGVGDILTWIEERGLRQTTMVVITADHGEAFGEHGYDGHGASLREEEVRVPLFVCMPGGTGARFQVPVSTIDATATMLTHARANRDGLDGVNLLPLITQGAYPEGRPVFMELHRYRSKRAERTHDVRAIVVDNWKVLWDRNQDTIELHDLKSDPAESKNVYAEHPKRGADLRKALEAFVAAAEKRHPLP